MLTTARTSARIVGNSVAENNFGRVLESTPKPMLFFRADPVRQPKSQGTAREVSDMRHPFVERCSWWLLSETPWARRGTLKSRKRRPAKA